MKNISIRSVYVLPVLALVAVGLMILVEETKSEHMQPYFKEKKDAANLMESCIEYLKNTHFKDEVTIDNINDPNDTRIIGTRFSAITSGRGSLPIKLSTVNPNFAALLVELFKEANLKKGDHIAIGATGSFPALDIAALSAAEILGLDVSYIASVTSSSWGANDPEYTFPDMHASLIKGGLLTKKITASSIGANDDIGRTLSPEGRELVHKAIERNNLFFINGKSLKENISTRMNIFNQKEKEKGKKIKLYINIGGGIASLGSSKNSNDLPSGLLKDVKLNLFPDKEGVMFEMASRKIPLINLKHIAHILNKYDLPLDPVPLPAPGEGKLFYDLKYNLPYVYGSAALLIFIIFGIIAIDKKQNALGNKIIKKEEK